MDQNSHIRYTNINIQLSLNVSKYFKHSSNTYPLCNPRQQLIMLLPRCILFSSTLPLLVFSFPATPSNSSMPSIPASETASPSGGSPFSTSAPSSWQHPGFVISKPQLDFVKSQLSGKAQPWTDAYNKMLGDKDKYGAYVSATRSSKARATVECGPVTNPDIGCTDERGDALAAWSNALAGYLTGNEEYTKNAILYMNKWSTVVKCTFSVKICLESISN